MLVDEDRPLSDYLTAASAAAPPGASMAAGEGGGEGGESGGGGCATVKMGEGQQRPVRVSKETYQIGGEGGATVKMYLVLRR